MNDTPLVSFIISVHNDDRYLKKALISLSQQTYSNIEILCINDNSTDHSNQILDTHTLSDHRFNVSHESENLGLTKRLNELATQANGKYLARMDADDMALPNRIETQVEYLENDQDIVALGTWATRIDTNDRPLSNWETPLHNNEIETKHLSGRPGQIIHPTALIRKDAFQKVGGYCESYRYTQDYDLWLKLGEIGLLENLPVHLLKYRVHPTAITTNHKERQAKTAKQILSTAFERRGLNNQSNKFNLEESLNTIDRQLTTNLKNPSVDEIIATSMHYKFHSTAIQYQLRDFFKKPNIKKMKNLVYFIRESCKTN